MTRRCKTCGQPLPPKLLNSAALLDLLRHAQPHREVYQAQRGGWFISHGGGETTESAVRRLVDAGQIQSVYSNCPDAAYHIGRTWDCERTLEARKRLGKAAPNYFVGDK